MRRSLLAALALASLAPTPAHASATITIAAGAGFNDPTVVAPVGNNPGTTLGQQRLNAFQAAADIWGAQLNSNVTIVVSAQFTALSCDANSAVLGSAGATTFFRDFTNAPLPSTWYPVALANSLAGSDLNGGTAEINANFNANLGNAGCLTGFPFYLGADNNAPANAIDLVTVLLHEFGHGLGFATLVGSSGAEANGFPDAFERHLRDNSLGQLWPTLTQGQRATSSLNTRNVGWDGTEIEAAVPAQLGLGQGLLTLTAPVSRESLVGTASFGPPLVGPISAPITIPEAGNGNGCSAIATNLTGKIALLDGDTCSATSKVKRAQTAGALAALVINNFAGSVLYSLSGSDGTITIPSAPITANDGTFLKANLSGLTANLRTDATRRRGADVEVSPKPHTYNPNPFEGGSSVSHWDTTTSPNTLMEPALNADVGYDVDLTLPAFMDIGWSVATSTTPTLSIDDVTVTEGNSGTLNAVFTVSLSASSADPVTVQYATAAGTATAGTDYTSLPLATLTFAPGQTSKPVTVKVKGDVKDEDNETFFLNLSNPTNAELDDAQGQGTINDNDGPPALSMANVTTPEGSTNKMLTLTVKLTPASGKTVSVNYATANGTATLANGDYLAASGTLTFTPGQTSKTFKVTIKGDSTFEPDETFVVNLTGASNATVLAPQATVTLTNDDPAPVPVSASINDVTLAEGDTGSTNAVFTVSLTPAPTTTVSLSYSTANGTAIAPGDYTAKSGVLTFTAGQATKTASVPVKGDKAQEANETFFVNLSNPVGVTFSDSQGRGTILNNDAPALSIADKSIVEGDTGTKNLTFAVTLSGVALNTVTVNWQTAIAGPPGPTVATPDVDYVTSSGTVTFTPGQTSRTFTVAIKGDTEDESDETFLVNLSAPTNASIADGQAVGTIIDDAE
jgi:Calx-beta domain/PA domain